MKRVAAGRFVVGTAATLTSEKIRKGYGENEFFSGLPVFEHNKVERVVPNALFEQRSRKARWGKRAPPRVADAVSVGARAFGPLRRCGRAAGASRNNVLVFEPAQQSEQPIE